MASQLMGYVAADWLPKPLHAHRARFVQRTFGARARALGWKWPANEDDDVRLIRPTLLGWVANSGEDPALIAEAKKLADAWLSDRKAIAPDLVGSVLAVAARNGDRALFDKFRAAAKVEKERKDRNFLLGAMAGFRDPEIAKVAMAITLTDEHPTYETIRLVWGALGFPETRELAYQFVKTNFDALVARMPRDSEAGFIGIGAAFCDVEHRDDAATFFKDRAPKWLNGPRSLARMIERADVCVARRRALEPGITAFLKRW
jgi:alanyl aminopeptidase